MIERLEGLLGVGDVVPLSVMPEVRREAVSEHGGSRAVQQGAAADESKGEAPTIRTNRDEREVTENNARQSSNTRVYGMAEFRTPMHAHGVAIRSGIADYSWIDLKRISRAIAAEEDDAKALRIAHDYHLTNRVGKLRGDVKSLTLVDGTKTSVR